MLIEVFEFSDRIKPRWVNFDSTLTSLEPVFNNLATPDCFSDITSLGRTFLLVNNKSLLLRVDLSEIEHQL